MGDTIFPQQPCLSTTPPAIDATPAHWSSRNTLRLHLWISWYLLFCVCYFENSLEANTDKRPELDIHLSVCQIMAHVYWLHCLGRTDRGGACTYYCHSFKEAAFIAWQGRHWFNVEKNVTIFSFHTLYSSSSGVSTFPSSSNLFKRASCFLITHDWTPSSQSFANMSWFMLTVNQWCYYWNH